MAGVALGTSSDQAGWALPGRCHPDQDSVPASSGLRAGRHLTVPTGPHFQLQCLPTQLVARYSAVGANLAHGFRPNCQLRPQRQLRVTAHIGPVGSRGFACLVRTAVPVAIWSAGRSEGVRR